VVRPSRPLFCASSAGEQPDNVEALPAGDQCGRPRLSAMSAGQAIDMHRCCGVIPQRVVPGRQHDMA
jgi:hypothetical protein